MVHGRVGIWQWIIVRERDMVQIVSQSLLVLHVVLVESCLTPLMYGYLFYGTVLICLFVQSLCSPMFELAL